jgi:hypothetical protein
MAARKRGESYDQQNKQRATNNTAASRARTVAGTAPTNRTVVKPPPPPPLRKGATAQEYLDWMDAMRASGTALPAGMAALLTPPQQTGPSAGDAGARAAAAAQERANADARAAQAKAEAEAAAAMARAGARYKSQAENLDPQIAALRHALDVTFKQSLDQNLTDIDGLLGEQFDMLKKGASARALEFLAGAKNTEQATAGQAEGSMSNLVRERQDTLGSLLQQGVGQTDMLRAMVGAARNWQSNINEGNRSYFDSMQSTNAAINDLNVDTQSALSNTHNQTESERERLWQDFYNRRSETFTQLGNTYTSQADYLDLAKEQKTGEGGGAKKTLSGTAFMDASNEAGKSYVRQAVPDWIKDYKGQEKVSAKVTNSDLAAAMQFEPLGGPEGASLRKWG